MASADVHAPSRIEDLSQLQQEGVLEDSDLSLGSYGVGVDCHSRFVAVCVYARNGDSYVRAEREFSTAWTDLVAARDWVIQTLRGCAVDVEPGDLRYTLESTGCYHLPVCLSWGGQASVVNPTLAGHTRRKTDTLDARMLAYQALTGIWPRSYLASAEVQTLRVVMAARRRHVKAATQNLNRINNMLLRFGHTLGAAGPLSRADLRPVAEDLAAGRDAGPGSRVSPIPLPPAVGELVARAYAEYDEAQAEARAAVRRAVSIVEGWTITTESGHRPGHEVLKLLCTVPGVGEVTALTWLAEVGDWRRFPNAKAVAAYCGCDPSLKVSAGHVTSQVRRRGNEALHAALIQAAQYLVRTAREPVGEWGRRLWLSKGKGGWQRAVGAVARRIAVGLYWVHRRGEPFDVGGYAIAPVQRPETPVEEMGLPPGVLRVVLKQGWRTSADVERASTQGFRAIKGVGPRTAEVLTRWLRGLPARPAG